MGAFSAISLSSFTPTRSPDTPCTPADKKGKTGKFIFGGEVKDEVFARRTIEETHEAWVRLLSGKEGGGGGAPAKQH